MTIPTDPAADLAALTRMTADAASWLDASAARTAPPSPDPLSLVNEGVSRWSPRQHLDHAALATTSVLGAVEMILHGSDRCVPPGPPDANLGMILTTGFIPRGRAEAPASMKPAPDVSHAAAREHLDGLARRLAEFAPLAAAIASAERRFPHFALGPMTAAEWIRFAKIHFDHHVAIARDAADS